MKHQKVLSICEMERRKIREQLVKTFLKEEPGTGKGDACSVYHYEVEKLAGGKTVFLKRPARLNKGFDIEIHVSGETFLSKPNEVTGKRRKTTMPSHDNILEDLKDKKNDNPNEFKKVQAIIDKIYDCKIVSCKAMRSLNFRTGYPIEMILKSIKWLFIEQDVTYWNWSGRNMLYSGLKSL